jgi:hypothetical protein
VTVVIRGVPFVVSMPGSVRLEPAVLDWSTA